ncbi:MAG: hypothetical protein K6G90_00740 [Clostridia bacterium]|nr:hypothetical protein [Clostridia bacterium]
MKLFNIKKGRYWGVYVFDKPLVVKLIFCNMRCEKISNTVQIPDDITIVPIDGELLERIKKMKYRVKQFFDEDRDSFYGMVALVGDVPCGYVCGRKEYKDSEKKSDKPDSYYIRQHLTIIIRTEKHPQNNPRKSTILIFRQKVPVFRVSA